MNKVRVEVFYQDNALQSIRIDHYEMEGQSGLCPLQVVPAGKA